MRDTGTVDAVLDHVELINLRTGARNARHVLRFVDNDSRRYPHGAYAGDLKFEHPLAGRVGGKRAIRPIVGIQHADRRARWERRIEQTLQKAA